MACEQGKSVFKFLPSVYSLTRKYETIGNKRKRYYKKLGLEERYLDIINEYSFNKFFREEVIKSFDFLNDNKLLSKYNISSENIKILLHIRLYFKRYINEMSFDDYKKIRDFCFKIGTNELLFIEECFRRCFMLNNSKPEMIESIINGLEFKNIVNSDLEQLKAIDSFEIIITIINELDRVIREYASCFVIETDRLSLEQKRKYGINKKCNSYDEAKEKIEKDSIDDLMLEIDLQFGFLVNEPYNILFGSIMSRMYSRRFYGGRMMSEIEITLLKILQKNYSILSKSRHSNSEIKKYICSNRIDYVFNDGDSKHRLKKYQGNLRALHKPVTRTKNK